MILIVVLYFVVATAVLALVLIPAARQRAFGWAGRMMSGSAAIGQSLTRQSAQGADQLAKTIGSRATQATRWLARHRHAIGAASILLIAAPLAALLLRSQLSLDGFDHRFSRETNEQVAALLQGEQLVPPPPLPPEMFATREIETARPLIAGASRQWELLDPNFRQQMLVVFKLMREKHGYDMVLLEGYRSPERQTRLAELGPRVTRAAAFESWHQYGLAADCAFMKDGRIVISEQDPWAAAGYAAYGEVARSVGLTWGGGWRSLKDFGHVEMHRAGVLKARAEAEQPVSSLAH